MVKPVKFIALEAGLWALKIITVGNGNRIITYDVIVGFSDKEESILFKSPMNCIGELTLVAGKFDDETGMCTFYVMDGEKVFINYKGKGTGGQCGSGEFVIGGGTGKYEKISGTGFSSRQNLKGKAGMAHSLNQMSGSYTY